VIAVIGTLGLSNSRGTRGHDAISVIGYRRIKHPPVPNKQSVAQKNRTGGERWLPVVVLWYISPSQAAARC